MSEGPGLTSHKSSCNCTGCGMLRAGVCINCAEKAVALILESAPGEDRRRAVLGRLPRGDRAVLSPPRQSAGARRSRDERGPRGVQRGELATGFPPRPLALDVLHDCAPTTRVRRRISHRMRSSGLLVRSRTIQRALESRLAVN